MNDNNNSLDTLIDSLTDWQLPPSKRQETVDEISRRADSRAVARLIDLIRNHDQGAIYLSATLALVKVGTTAIEQLGVALDDSNALLRDQAATALGLMNNPGAIVPLIKSLASLDGNLTSLSRHSLLLLQREGHRVLDDLIPSS